MINMARAPLIHALPSSLIPLKMRAIDKTAVRVATFFMAPIHAAWLVILCRSILYCFPIPVMKSIIMRTPKIVICSCGIRRYSKRAKAPKYPASFAVAIVELVVPAGIRLFLIG